MAASERRILANRINALKSTGPKTPEGKLVARANALKHGMAAQVVVPAAEVETVAARVASARAHLAPDGDGFALMMAERAAYLLARLKRCQDWEEAMAEERVRNAEADFDEARRARADHLISYIACEPVTSCRQLMSMPEGIDRLVEAHQLLLDQAGLRWSVAHADRFDRCTGRRPGEIPCSRMTALTEWLVRDNAEAMDPAELANAPADRAARRDYVLPEVRRILEGEIARLEALRPTLDHDRIAASRAAAGHRAAGAAEPALVQPRRYEATADRALKRTLDEIRAYRRDRQARAIDAVDAAQQETQSEYSAEVREHRDDPAPPPPMASFAPEPLPNPALLPQPIDLSTFAIGKPPKHPRRGP